MSEAHARLLNPHTAPHGCKAYCESHGLWTKRILNQYQLGCEGEWLVIPYLSRGRVLQVKYRCTADHDHGALGHGKYRYDPGTTTRLFNTAAYFDANGTIALAEGEVDAIAATEHLGIPTMGYAGTAQWHSHGEYWEVALRDFERVVIFADGDEPGITSARTIAADLGKRASIVRCPDGEDVASMVHQGRTEELKGKL